MLMSKLFSQKKISVKANTLKTKVPNIVKHISKFLLVSKVAQVLGHLDTSNPGSAPPPDL